MINRPKHQSKNQPNQICHSLIGYVKVRPLSNTNKVMSYVIKLIIRFIFRSFNHFS